MKYTAFGMKFVGRERNYYIHFCEIDNELHILSMCQVVVHSINIGSYALLAYHICQVIQEFSTLLSKSVVLQKGHSVLKNTKGHFQNFISERNFMYNDITLYETL